ncbi:MAG: hypothetical protein Q9166_000311 [cf. Caloplaca sp. 2 TL-2023]
MSQQQQMLLGSKERSLFTQVVKHYEAKQYKKGLKCANQILGKNPNHGDTQAMKALIINAQGNSEEAFVLCKVALKNAMKSHVCWHVYGLLWRCVKDYDEAIKAYKFALKLEPDSQQILRDLALLQMQIRDYQGYIQSRRIILQSTGPRGKNSTSRQNWTALAVAQHLAGDLYDAERTLTTFEETLRSPPSKSDNEHSEAVLYKNTIIAEMGETERALDHLQAVFKNNLDRTAVMEMRASYLLQLDRKQEAEKAYRALLERNADYRAYYEGLREALGLGESDTESLKALYDECARKNPRSDTPRRVPLDFLHREEFRKAVDQYLQQMLHKGVPSTFANIKALYSDSAKRDIIQGLAESYLDGTHEPMANGSPEKPVNGKQDSSSEQSQFEVSVLYFLAQHYNYHRSQNLAKAMELIDRAIAARPEEVNFHMTRARIWKHRGNSQKASETMEKARSLDEKDRYINTKAAKYQLRNNQNEAANMNMGKFTRKEAVGGPLGDLIEMQCMWYITEDGESYLRQGKLGLALKRFTSVYDIFDIWQEDQFDFHTFSLRKGQIRAYIDMVKWQDHLREHPFFSRAAISAVKIYIRLADKPQLRNESLNGVNGNAEKMSPSEFKKAQKKARKAQEKQEQAEAEKADAKKTASVGADREPKKEDKDPKGVKLVGTTEPLADAMKFLTPLLEFSPKNIAAQHVGFEVFLRRKKYPLALRCLLAARSIDSSHSTNHEQAIRLRHTLNSLPDPLPPKISEVLDAELSSLISSDADLLKLNTDFLTKHSDSAAHVQASLCARQLLDPKTADENQKDVIRTLAVPSVSLEDAIQGLDLLKDWKAELRYRNDYVAAAHERWPDATAFTSKQSLTDRLHQLPEVHKSMAERPPLKVEAAANNALPPSRPKPPSNPVFRMMGLPNFRLKLPSRNWLMFLSITGSFTTAVLYDKYHKKKAQQRWINLVSHIAQEPLPSTQMPRRITIFLAAPPNDSLRVAREHFHEYVKPVLAAGAMDWDVIEGRREGDVRAGLAEKIRKRRKRDGEKPTRITEAEPSDEGEDLVQELRNTAGVKDWEGVQGDLVLGRHTWKEYIRGLHEGWLGPLDPPPDASHASAPPKDASVSPIEQPSLTDDASPASDLTQSTDNSTLNSHSGNALPEEPKPEQKKEEKPKQSIQQPPYISASDYPSAPLAPSTPAVLPPTTVLPLPHILGFLNTPTRIYRFLNRRHLADETGRETAALVLASYIRAWDAHRDFASSTDPDASSSSMNDPRSEAVSPDVVPIQKRWEPTGVLEEEERDWHKSAWKGYHGEPERVWRNTMVIEPRIGEKLRRFDLTGNDEEKAKKDDGIDPARKGLWENVKETVGWGEDKTVKGWEHGFVGEESV